MMTELRATNLALFWRIIRRLLSANRGRLFVMLLALGAGTSGAAALLKLQVDAKRRLTSEFRSFGANVLITPHDHPDVNDLSAVMDDSLFDRVPTENAGQKVTKAEFLYGVAQLSARDRIRQSTSSRHVINAIVSGYAVASGSEYLPHGLGQVAPSVVVGGKNLDQLNVRTCDVGRELASRLNLSPDLSEGVVLKNSERQDWCAVAEVRGFGGPEDSQLFLELPAAQALLDRKGKITLIQLSVPGTPRNIEHYISDLRIALPEVEVHGIRQFTEGEAKIYNRISGLLRSEEHTSELQSRPHLVCRLLLEKKNRRRWPSPRYHIRPAYAFHGLRLLSASECTRGWIERAERFSRSTLSLVHSSRSRC